MTNPFIISEVESNPHKLSFRKCESSLNHDWWFHDHKTQILKYFDVVFSKKFKETILGLKTYNYMYNH